MPLFDKDVQDSSPLVDVPLDKIGIVGLEKKVEIIHDNRTYSFYPKISALISLLGQQRGIHMSRTSETIEEVINEVILTPTPSIELIGESIARKLIERHSYTTRAEVNFKGKIIIQVRDKEERIIQKAYTISSRVIAKKKEDQSIEFNYFLGASAVGMTVCPCAKEMSQEYSEKVLETRKDIKISPADIKKVLNILPIASHNQRSIGTIVVQIKDLNRHKIDILDLINIIEDSMSGKIQSVLKRPEESELVRIAHLNPLFSEDVVRGMAKNFALKYLPNLDKNLKVSFKITSFESIHPHNVYAELKTTVGKLKEMLKTK